MRLITGQARFLLLHHPRADVTPHRTTSQSPSHKLDCKGASALPDSQLTSCLPAVACFAWRDASLAWLDLMGEASPVPCSTTVSMAISTLIPWQPTMAIEGLHLTASHGDMDPSAAAACIPPRVSGAFLLRRPAGVAADFPKELETTGCESGLCSPRLAT